MLDFERSLSKAERFLVVSRSSNTIRENLFFGPKYFGINSDFFLQSNIFRRSPDLWLDKALTRSSHYTLFLAVFFVTPYVLFASANLRNTDILSQAVFGPPTNPWCCQLVVLSFKHYSHFTRSAKYRILVSEWYSRYYAIHESSQGLVDHEKLCRRKIH